MAIQAAEDLPKGPAGAKLAALAAVILIARLPFLLPGYGGDPDAWRIAADGRAIASSGVYGAARSPGNPILELAAAVVWRGGPLALNGLTCLFGLLAVLAFALSLSRLGVRDWIWGALALAFTPVIAINSANAMDYLWALAFLLAAHDAALRARPVEAGILTGLAIGCRITSAVLAPTYSIILSVVMPPHHSARRRLAFWAWAGMIGIAAYAPALMLTGLGFLHDYGHGYPAPLYVLKNATVDVWGLVGCAAWSGALIVSRWRAERPAAPPAFADRRIPIAWGLAILLEVAVFLRLPHQAEYLIPVVPFALLLGARALPSRAFRPLCVSLVLSAFAIKVSETGKPDSPGRVATSFPLPGGRRVLDLRGPLLIDHDRRVRGVEYAQGVIARAATLPAGSVVLAYEWLPAIEVMAPSRRVGGARFVYALPPDSLDAVRAAADSLYDLPGAEDYGLSMWGVSPRSRGSRPLDASEQP